MRSVRAAGCKRGKCV